MYPFDPADVAALTNPPSPSLIGRQARDTEVPAFPTISGRTVPARHRWPPGARVGIRIDVAASTAARL